LKGLRWKNTHSYDKTLKIERQSTKTDAGARVIISTSRSSGGFSSTKAELDGRQGSYVTFHDTKPFLDNSLSRQLIDKYGTPGVTRTRDPLLRRQVLYPTELRAHFKVNDLFSNKA
jgi:hypothetical protein